MKRAKTLALAGAALSGAGALAAGAQPWVLFSLDAVGLNDSLTGTHANAALTPLSLALIASALALTIAGRVFRWILGALQFALGAGIVAIAITALVSPAAAISARVTELTGIGDDAEAVSSISVTAWCWIAAAAGLLGLLCGVLVLVTGNRWGAAGGKYEPGDSARSERPRGSNPQGAGNDRISEWDALTNGDDPTEGDDIAAEGPEPR